MHVGQSENLRGPGNRLLVGANESGQPAGGTQVRFVMESNLSSANYPYAYGKCGLSCDLCKRFHCA